MLRLIRILICIRLLVCIRILICIIIVSFTTSAKAITKIKTSSSIVQRYITKECKNKKLNCKWMRALAKTESGFDPKQTSVNKKGKKRSYCRGVYQILDSTAKSFCKINDPKLLYNYQINIKCGFKYFKHLLKKYKRYDNAVLAFNAGAVYKNEKGIPFNIQYLIRVRSNKN